MDQQDISYHASNETTKSSQKRSALGVGITTLITVMVVLLLTAFAVLSYASASSSLDLSQMAVDQAQMYYSSDSEATVWYAELDAFAATMTGEPDSFEDQLVEAGYEVQDGDGEELHVTKGFTINENRTLMVSIAINDDKTTTIRQWQS